MAVVVSLYGLERRYNNHVGASSVGLATSFAMSDHGLLIASMRRVLELYYLTEPETRIALPSYMPDATTDPDAFAQMTRMRLRFAMVQGLLNAINPQPQRVEPVGPQGTPFQKAADRLARLDQAAFLEVVPFMRVVEEKRRDQEDALNQQLRDDSMPGWKRKRGRVYKLQDRNDERLRVRLNAHPDIEDNEIEPPIYLLMQVNRNMSYPLEYGSMHVEAALVVGNATFDDPNVCFNKYYFRTNQVPATRLVSSVHDLVMDYMTDFYIDKFVLMDVVQRVLTPNGVDLEQLHSIMERPMAQLVEYETFWTTYRDKIVATPSSYLALDPDTLFEQGDQGYDLTTIKYMGYSMKRFLQQNDWDSGTAWASVVYANPARKNDEPRAYQRWLNAYFPMHDQRALQADTMALLLLEHCA